MTKQEFIKQMVDNETFQLIKYLADKYGYVCEHAYIRYNYPRVELYRKDRGWDDKHPDIYLETAHFAKEGNCKYTWKVPTVSYGSLEGEELERYMHDVTDGFNFYNELKNIDLYKLPTCPEEFDENEDN